MTLQRLPHLTSAARHPGRGPRGCDHPLVATVSQTLLPPEKRNPARDLLDQLDLDSGERIPKRSGFVIMLLLSAVIATAGVITDSTATVIGAMIIAPLGTPILGIALGIVTGRAGLVARSTLWVAGGLAAVVAVGALFSFAVIDPADLASNSQVSGRTSPTLMDLVAALATGVAGAFAMCRRDLSAVLPGVAIAISLVPPLAVVGVCAGQGQWNLAFGAFLLFFSNVVAMIIAGSAVFTLAGYTRDPDALPARRTRAYAIVAVLTVVMLLPLAFNTLLVVVKAAWTADISSAAGEWLGDDFEGELLGVEWDNLIARVNVKAPDGEVPRIDDLQSMLESAVPPLVSVELSIADGIVVPVLPVP
jgi:uncharacterized hydrophobic protein (TIGR00271 family)